MCRAARYSAKSESDAQFHKREYKSTYQERGFEVAFCLPKGLSREVISSRMSLLYVCKYTP